MNLDLNAEEIHWLKYALILAIADLPDRNSESRAIMQTVLHRLDDDNFEADEPSRFPFVNQDDPNKPGVEDQF